MKKLLLTILLAALTLSGGCSGFNSEPDPTAAPTPSTSPLESHQAGLEFLAGNDFAAGGDAFQTAVEIDPSFGPGYAGLALSQLWAGGPPAEVLALAEQGANSAPDDPFTQAVLAYALLENHRSTEAAANAGHAYQLAPEDPFVGMVASLALVGNYEYEPAWEILNSVYTQNPDSPEILYAFGNYFSATKDFGHALAAFEQAVSLNPEFVVWQLGLAQFYFDASRYDQVEPLLEEITELVPDYLPAEILSVRNALQRHQFPLAEERLASIPLDLVGTWVNNLLQAELAIYQEKFAAAEELLVELENDPFSARYLTGTIYLQQQACNLAATLYSDLNDKYPGAVEPIIGAGWAELCADELDTASVFFLEALRIDPFQEDAYFGLAEVYSQQEEWQLAQEMLDNALGMEKSLAAAHLSQAKLLFRSGSPAEAEAELQLALELDPYNQDALNMLAGMHLTYFQVEEGLEVVGQSAALNPESSTAQALEGMLRYLNGEQDGTLELLDQAITADSENASLYLFKALSLREQGATQQAAGILDTHIALLENEEADQDTIHQAKRLFQAMDDGYQITPQRALNLIETDLASNLKNLPGMYIGEYQDQGSAMIVNLLIQPVQIRSEDYLADLAQIAAVAAVYLPRVTPGVEAGLVIDVNLGGRDLFIARLSLFEMKNFADTLITPEVLLNRISFDLADSTVQRDSINKIIADVASLRDLHLDQIPEYEIISKEAVREDILEDFDQESLAEMVDGYKSMTMLGAIADDIDLSELVGDYIGTNIAGLYNSRDQKIYVVSNDRLTSYDQITIAHECEHALADQYFGLNAIQSQAADDDRALAALSLVEGDATLASIHYLHEILPDLGWWAAGSPQGDDPDREVQEIPDFISNMSNFPYTYGRDFVAYLYDVDGWDEVNRAFRDPPISSEQIIHPEKYLTADRPKRVFLDDFSGLLGDRWELVEENVIGEYGIFLTLSEHIGGAAARTAAAGWGGDRFLLLEKTRSYEQAMAWKTVWDDAAEAEEFWSIFTTAMFHRYEYREVVENFSIEPEMRIWQYDDGYLAMVISDDLVTIVIGPDLDQLEMILDVIE